MVRLCRKFLFQESTGPQIKAMLVWSMPETKKTPGESLYLVDRGYLQAVVYQVNVQGTMTLHPLSVIKPQLQTNLWQTNSLSPFLTEMGIL